MNARKTIFFGTGGVAEGFCKNTGTLPDLFVDNDKSKWGKSFNGVEIHNPNVLSEIQIEKVVITSSFLKDIKPQVLALGVPEGLVVEPSKKDGSLQLFRKKTVREEAANELSKIFKILPNYCKLVAVGGTALGFVREQDFIEWDDDIDLFAPHDARSACISTLGENGYEIREVTECRMKAILTELPVFNELSIPLSIQFFKNDHQTFLDTFEDFSWEWPTKMFLNCKSVNIHGFSFNVPNPPELYLSKVFGSTWKTRNPEFGYSDYGGRRDQING